MYITSNNFIQFLDSFCIKFYYTQISKKNNLIQKILCFCIIFCIFSTERSVCGKCVWCETAHFQFTCVQCEANTHFIQCNFIHARDGWGEKSAPAVIEQARLRKRTSRSKASRCSCARQMKNCASTFFACRAFAADNKGPVDLCSTEPTEPDFRRARHRTFESRIGLEKKSSDTIRYHCFF